MSDTFEGPGYWMASDGKWYPPERHPDPGYRAQFETPIPTPPEVPVPPAIPESHRLSTSDEISQPAQTRWDAASESLLGSEQAADADATTGHQTAEAATQPERTVPTGGDVTSDVTQAGFDELLDSGRDADLDDSTAETVELVPPSIPEPEPEPEHQIEAQGFPSVGLRIDDNDVAATHGSLFEMGSVTDSDDDGVDIAPDRSEPAHIDAHTSPGEPTEPEWPGDDNGDTNEEAARPAPSFSVGSTTFTRPPERPVFDVPTPRSVVGTTTKTETPDVGGLELELDQPAPAERAPVRVGAAKPNLSASTALAVIPSTPPELAPVSLLDRLLAAAIFCAGVAMIVGTFLEWTTGSVIQTGWERGDGIATIIAGVVGSATAGPIYVGYHHIIPKAVAIISGLVGLVVIGLTAVGTLLDSAAADTSVGVGFVVVLIGSAIMVIAGLAHRVDLRY